ncbi:MAG: cytochrome c biogenesis protein ResB, partial [Proteobacteria bacterium]|nr:cytochrome c biogenesis protein ResB [Pseudomonadota bacterium]
MSPAPSPARKSGLDKWIDLVWRSPSALSIWRGLGLGLAAGLWTAVVMETWNSLAVPGLGIWSRMLLILEGLASDTTGPLTSSWWFVAFILACGVALGRGFSSFWGSVKLTIVLMAALAAACIAGTLISQSDVAQTYAKTYNLAYPDSSLVFRLFVWHDIFHARWFVGLLLALSLNLVVCTLKRWGKTWNVISRPAAERGRKVPVKQAPLAAFGSDRPLAETLSLAERFFGRRFGRARVREVAGGPALYAERGRISRLGVYVIHLSVLVIYAGAIIGLWFGFRGDMQVWEEDSNRFYQGADNRRRGLPFMVYLNRFQLVCNPTQPDHVDQYRSLVMVVEPMIAGVDNPDWPLESLRVLDEWGFWPEVIEVNLRMFHRGVAFSQSSWGAVARGVVLRVIDTFGRQRMVRLPFRSLRRGMLHQPLHLMDLGLVLVVNRVAGP